MVVRDVFGDWPNCYDMSEMLMEDELLEFSEHVDKSNWVSLHNCRSIERAMELYSPLAAIVMRMSEMFSRGKFEILNRATRNYTRGQYREWDRVLLRPNPFQTRTEFLKQAYINVLMNGFCYAMPVYMSGNYTGSPNYIYLIPPEMIEVKPIKQKLFTVTNRDKIREVWFNWGGVREQLNENELILFKDTSSPFIDKQTFLQKSRLINLKYPISNGIGGQESQNALINDRGANGILSNTVSDVHGAVPIPKDEMEKLEKEYKNKYGLKRSKMNVIITKAALKYTPMTFNYKDLGLNENHVACIKEICDNLGYQYRLLSTGDGATYANALEDKKGVYNDIIMAQSESLMEQLNIGLKTLEDNIEICMSYEHVYVFQSSEKEKGEGRKALNDALKVEWDNFLISRNTWLLELGRDIVGSLTDAENPFNKYKNELKPEELGIIVDNVNNQNNGNK